MRYTEVAGSRNATTQTLGLSGISATGAQANTTGAFADSSLSLSPGGTASTDLSLDLQGLRPGIYDITLSAAAAPGGVVYSVVLILNVSGGGFLSSDLLILLAAGIAVASGAGGWALSRRYWSRRRRNRQRRASSSHKRSGRRRPPFPPAYPPIRLLGMEFEEAAATPRHPWLRISKGSPRTSAIRGRGPAA